MLVSHSPGMDEKVILNVCRHADFLACDFFYQGFLSRTLPTHGTAGKGRDYLLFHFITSTRSRTFRYFFVTLHVKWLSHIFNRTACIYQTATQWDLPPNWITIWLIDDLMFMFVYLLTMWFLFLFVYLMIWY